MWPPLLAPFVSKFIFVVYVRNVCSKHARTHTHTQWHTHALCGFVVVVVVCRLLRVLVLPLEMSAVKK